MSALKIFEKILAALGKESTTVLSAWQKFILISWSLVQESFSHFTLFGSCSTSIISTTVKCWIQVWFGLELLLWPFNPDDLNGWSKRSWLRYLNHLFLIGRKWTAVTFSSLATYSLHLSLALFILKFFSSKYIICLNKYNKSSFLTFSCFFFLLIYLNVMQMIKWLFWSRRS